MSKLYPGDTNGNNRKINCEILAGGVTVDSRFQLKANIGTDSSSEPLVVTVGGIDSINSNSNRTRYNQEPNNTNNNGNIGKLTHGFGAVC